MTLTPDDLFRVARGGEAVTDNGQRFKQDRPLDWLSITDHAEYLGIADQIRTGNPDLLADPTGKRWYEMSKDQQPLNLSQGRTLMILIPYLIGKN